MTNVSVCEEAVSEKVRFHINWKLFAIVAMIWAVTGISLSTWKASAKHEQQEIQFKVSAYVATHNCEVFAKYPASRGYDYVLGAEIPKPGRTRYKCEGLDDTVVVLDK